MTWKNSPPWLMVISTSIAAIVEVTQITSFKYLAIPHYLIIAFSISCFSCIYVTRTKLFKSSSAFAAPRLVIATYAANAASDRNIACILFDKHFWKIEREIWARSIIAFLCIFFLAMSLAISPNQSSSYAWFVIHPLVTSCLGLFDTDGWHQFQRQFKPLLIAISASMLYALTDPSIGESMNIASSINGGPDPELGRWLALASGILYSLQNYLSEKAKRNTNINSSKLALYGFCIGLILAVCMALLSLYLSWREAPSAHFPVMALKYDAMDIHIAVGGMIAWGIGMAFIALFEARAMSVTSVSQQSSLAVVDLTIVVFAVIIHLIGGLIDGTLDRAINDSLAASRWIFLWLILFGAWLAYARRPAAAIT